MAEDTVERRDPRSLGRGAEQFEKEIHAAEIKSINERRAKQKRPSVELIGRQVVPTVGLALSGGGIRSAAFSLGVLQALNQHNTIKNIDYLSTVSGGGYIGSSLTATMTVTEGKFVFGDPPTDPPSPIQADISDTDQVGHIRNYSNYLIPYGFRDVMTGLAIIVRGWVANLGLVLPIILLAAALTALFNPTRASLKLANAFGLSDLPLVPEQHFGLTIVLAFVGLLLFFFWAIRRSFLKVNDLGEFRGRWPAVYGWFLAILGILTFIEIQPAVVSAMFDATQAVEESSEESRLLPGTLVSWFPLIVGAVPIAVVVAIFNREFAEAITSGYANKGWVAGLTRLAATGAVWLAGIALPLVIWIGYLYLAYWAIPSDAWRPSWQPAAAGCPANAEAGSLDLTFELGSLSGSAKGTFDCVPEEYAPPLLRGPLSHRPSWLQAGVHFLHELSDWFGGLVGAPPPAMDDSRWSTAAPAIIIYVVSGELILLLSLLLRPNSNSLHGLYRDRLSKAFLFDPRDHSAGGGISRGRDFKPLDIQLSQLRNEYAPYHLINAAVNIQGSDFATRHGRNADFFLFSPRYVGSPATGYARTELYESYPPDLDLGTALTISGAAFSSEMGSKSIRSLAPTLALLNMRLGHWLRNPLVVEKEARSGAWKNRRSGGPRLAPYYLLREMLGWLDEKTPVVYVTDGGHIENLGVYELLRRRCKLIIVVDSEPDPGMTFPSFVNLQLSARIDLGVRLRLPWHELSNTTLAWMGVGSQNKEEPVTGPVTGPHVAIGTIDYRGGETGYLVYVKSSLTGDESDYVSDYARRRPRFPHETNRGQFFNDSQRNPRYPNEPLVQFFSAEQFEVYRALGFHAIDGFLGGSADVLVDANLLPPSGWSAAAPSPRPGAEREKVEAGRKAQKPGAIIPADDPFLEDIRTLLDLATSDRPSAMPKPAKA